MTKPLRPLRCPKCRATSLRLVEISTVGMAFHQCADGYVRRIWGDGQDYAFDHVDAECLTCGHAWKMRDTPQIPNKLEREPPEELARPDRDATTGLHAVAVQAHLCDCDLRSRFDT